MVNVTARQHGGDWAGAQGQLLGAGNILLNSLGPGCTGVLVVKM